MLYIPVVLKYMQFTQERQERFSDSHALAYSSVKQVLVFNCRNLHNDRGRIAVQPTINIEGAVRVI